MAPKRKHEGEIRNIKFINLVKKYPCLYDTDAKNYKMRHIVQRVWETIAAECRSSVTKCKKRWKNIRTAYLRFIKAKISPNPKYRNYYLGDTLKFLLPIYERNYGSLKDAPSPKFELEEECDIDDDEVSEKKSYFKNMNKLSSQESDSMSDADDIKYEEYIEDHSQTQDNFVDIKEIPELSASQCDKRPLVHYVQKIENDDNIVTIDELSSSNHKSMVSEPLSADEQFLLSLKDDLSEMNPTQKRKFKRGVYDLIEQILDGTQILPNQFVLSLAPSTPVSSSISNVTQTVSSSNMPN